PGTKRRAGTRPEEKKSVHDRAALSGGSAAVLAHRLHVGESALGLRPVGQDLERLRELVLGVLEPIAVVPEEPLAGAEVLAPRLRLRVDRAQVLLLGLRGPSELVEQAGEIRVADGLQSEVDHTTIGGLGVRGASRALVGDRAVVGELCESRMGRELAV